MALFSNNLAYINNLEQDDRSDIRREEGDQNSARLLERRREVLGVDVAISRMEQIRFKLRRLGKSRSLHEIFERSRHFYYPQRLWIAFSVANVGMVFLFAVYMYGVKALCLVLSSLRISIMNLLAQINGFIGAAPTYIQLMMNNVNSIRELAGASHLCWPCCSRCYITLSGSNIDAVDGSGLPAGLFSYLQQGANSATAASDQVLHYRSITLHIALIFGIIVSGCCPVRRFGHADARPPRQSSTRCPEHSVYGIRLF
jgi:hypothetical protein